jgi:FtsH-binding integral membrane protein
MSMLQSKQNEQLIKIGNWLALKIEKYEMILAFLFSIVLLIRITGNFPVGVFLVLILSILATLYVLKAYSVSDDSNAGGIERFIDKLASLSLSVSMIGILFRFQHYPGYGPMLLMGSTTLVVVFLVILFLQSKKPELKIFTQRMKLRILIVAALGLLLYFAPAGDVI